MRVGIGVWQIKVGPDMGQVQQVGQLQPGHINRCAGIAAHDQHLGAVANGHASAAGGDRQLADIAQQPPAGQIDLVLPQGKILDPVGHPIGGQDKDIGPRPAIKQIIARPIRQNIGPVRTGQPVSACATDKDVIARGPGQGFTRKGGHPGYPGRTGVKAQHGNAGFTAAGGKNVDPAGADLCGERTDILQTHALGICDMRPGNQLSAGQQLHHADPVIRPARKNIGLPVQTDRGQGCHPGKAAAQIVDHMINHPQTAVGQNLHHADRP